jgi:hypothetical protein
MLVLLLVGMLTLAFNIQLAKASGVATVNRGSTSNTARVRFDPSEVSVCPGHILTVAVVIENISNLYGFDLQTTWNPAWLKYVNHTVTVPVETYPEGLLHGPIAKLKNVVDENGGIPYAATPETRAWIAYTSIPPAPSFNGSGKAFTMTFGTLNQTGITTLNFTSIVAGDPSGNDIPYTYTNGVVEFLPRDVAVTNVTPEKTIVGQNCSMSINVTVENQGNCTETFNVTAYAYPVRTTDGAMAYWSFNEGYGTTAHDSSGNDNHGTINGATWTDGRLGRALDFDGTDDYVQVPDSDSLDIQNEITVAAWIKPRPLANINFFVSKYDAYSLGLWWDPLKERCGIHFMLGSRVDDSDGPLNLNEWNHVAVTVNSTHWIFYINGVQDTILSGSEVYGVSSHDLLIGASYYVTDFFNGMVDDARIYNRTLSEEEIWALATMTGPPPIQTQIVTVGSGCATTISFTWNTTGFAYGNYSISAYAPPLYGEIDTADNTLGADKEVCVSIPGDLEGDFDVDLYDAVKLLARYGAKKGQPQYDPVCDIDGDGDIDLYDAVILLTHYGQKYP